MLLEDPGPACLVGGRGKAVTGERVVGRRCGGAKVWRGERWERDRHVCGVEWDEYMCAEDRWDGACV